MGFLDRFFRGNPLDVPGAINNEMTVNAFLESLGNQHRSDSGEVVNEHTSLQIATVWACVSLIAKQVATNPFNMYEFDGSGNRNLAASHDYFDLVNSKPNPYQDAIAFRTAVELSTLLTGNGYIEIQRDKGARAVALWHRSSYLTVPHWRPDATSIVGQKLWYKTTDSAGGEDRWIPCENMIHLMDMTRDGWVGMSAIHHHSQTFGKRIAMDKFGARFFANNATPSGILTMPANLKVKPEDKPKMRKDWEDQQLSGNQHRINILDQGTTFTPITIAQNDAQYLESSNATAEDIASIFGVPGYVVGLLSKSVKANVEQQNQDLYNLCLRPRMTRWEMAYTNKLFNNKGRSAGRYSVQFDMFKFLHPDSASLVVSNQSSIQNGVMSVNEARATVGLNSIGPVGDAHYIQLNMQTLELANSNPPVNDKPDTELALEQETNSLPKRLGQNYRGLFKDGATRLIKTSVRDHKAVYRCLWPTVDALARVAYQDLKGEHTECDKAVDELLIKIEHRCKKWSEENIEAICDEELKKVATSLIYAVNRDEANAKSKKMADALLAETEQE